MRFRNTAGARLVVLIALFQATAGYSQTGEVERGQYLTNLLGCEGCHTHGRIVGEYNGIPLSGSSIGIAYGQHVDSVNPPVVFASNLTPDDATGLGKWSRQDIALAIRHGADIHSRDLAPVMPWLNYRQLSEVDVMAIASYLQSLSPVRNIVPEPIDRGEVSEHMFVRLGIYLFVPRTIESAERAPADDEHSRQAKQELE